MESVLSCVVFGHIWQFSWPKVSILDSQSPKYIQVKGLQIGFFKGSWLPNVIKSLYKGYIGAEIMETTFLSRFRLRF